MPRRLFFQRVTQSGKDFLTFTKFGLSGALAPPRPLGLQTFVMKVNRLFRRPAKAKACCPPSSVSHGTLDWVIPDYLIS
jgi:hypothetical protein